MTASNRLKCLLITLASFVIVLSGCASFRQQIETDYINYARGALRDTILSQGIDRKCEFRFDLPYPKIHPRTSKELGDRFGYYHRETQAIYYWEFGPRIIPHEYFHYWAHINLNGPDRWECLEEIGAGLLNRVVDLEESNRKMRWKLNKKRLIKKITNKDAK